MLLLLLKLLLLLNSCCYTCVYAIHVCIHFLYSNVNGLLVVIVAVVHGVMRQYIRAGRVT